MEPNKNKLDYIDALRGIAVIGVVMVHTHQNFHTDTGAKFIALGQYGVMLFYIVSAFTLMLSLSSRNKIEINPISNYLIRRFFRIAPLFYIAIILYIIRLYIFPDDVKLSEIINTGYNITPLDVLLTFTFLNGWYYKTINFIVPGGWSVAVESNFYLILPFIYLFANNIKKTIILFFASIFLQKTLTKLIYIFIEPSLNEIDSISLGIYCGMWLPNQIPIFTMGILMFHLIANKNNSKTIEFVLKKEILVCASIVFVLASTTIPINYKSRYVNLDYFYMLGILTFSTLLSQYPTKFIVNKLTTYIGNVSYGVYLIHFLVIQAILFVKIKYIPTEYNFSFFIAFPIALTTSVFIAKIANKYIELPTQRIGKNIILKSERHASIKKIN